MKRDIVFCFIILAGLSARAADWSSRDGVDFGVTSNANLTKDNPVADEYVRLTSSNSMKAGSHFLGFRLSYADYFKESQNDSLSLKLSDSYQTTTPWKVNAAIVSRIYTQTNPGTTDTSFTNVGFDVSGSRPFHLIRGLHQEFEAGYRFRDYTSIEGRNDHNFFGAISIDKELSEKLDLGASTEIGLLASSISDYSRAYIEIAGSVDYQLPESWNWSSELSLAENSYTSRTISTQTVVNQQRGRRVVGTSAALESYLLLTASTEVMRKESQSFRWGFSLSGMNESSASGSLDFTTADLMARLLWNF